MKHYQPFTTVTASTVMFVVLLVSMLFITTQANFKMPEFKLANMPLIGQKAADVEISNSLAHNMSLVFKVGKEVGDPETLQAILLQETNGGQSVLIGNLNSPVGKRSYGIMQVQTCAARSILERFPKLFEQYFPGRRYSSVADEEIIALLLTNSEASVRIAAYHFKLYKALVKGDWSRAVAGYNAGIGVAQKLQHPAEFGYVKEVQYKIDNIVRPFNQHHGLQLTQRF